mgnify:CR=1 FL=1
MIIYLKKVFTLLSEINDSDVIDPIKAYRIGKSCQSLINKIIKNLREDLIAIGVTNPEMLERENYKLSRTAKYKVSDPSIKQEIEELKSKIKKLEKDAINSGKVEIVDVYRISSHINKPNPTLENNSSEDEDEGNFKDYFI